MLRHIALPALVALSIHSRCPVAFAQFVPAPASAANLVVNPGPNVSTRDEARRRFDRGLILYNAGDLNGALAEFRRAHQLTSHPLVLYNIALVEAGLGNSVNAVDALELLQKSGMAELGKQRQERAERVYREHLVRVGSIEVRTDVSGALIQIDNVDIARTPAAPVRVNVGTHLVSISAEGYEPRRFHVSVAGQAREVVAPELVPLKEKAAHLKVTSNVRDAEVRVDGELLARTPLWGELAMKPGQYWLEVRRTGYEPVRQRISLQPGGRLETNLELLPTEAGLRSGGILLLALSESGAIVSINGAPQLQYAGGIRLPVGRHAVLVQRAGFFETRRDVEIGVGTNQVDVTLLPTADYLADYVSRARAQRVSSYITMGAGALVAIGSGAFLIWNQSEKNEAKTRFDDFVDQARAEPGGCDEVCSKKVNILLTDLDEKRARDAYGFVGLGVGGVAVAAGALLYLLGNDPSRYDPAPESKLFGSSSVRIGPTSFATSLDF